MIKIIKTLLITIFAYFLQATAIPLLSFNDISGNIIISTLSVIIVAIGRQHGFASSLIFGILMETMVESLTYWHLLIYPILGVLGFLLFADKTDRRLEMERITKKKFAGNINPVIRTFLCTLVLSLIFETFNIFYELLRGVNFDFIQFSRALLATTYNLVITLIIIVPIRKIYGLRSYTPKFRRIEQIELADIDPTKGIQAIFSKDIDINTTPFYKNSNTSTIDKNPNQFIIKTETQTENSDVNINTNDIENITNENR